MQRTDRSATTPRVPPSFTVYATVTAGVATLAVVLLPWAHTWDISSPAQFWTLGLAVLVAEFLPIPVPRRHGLDKVTISTAFAFALLLLCGAGPATLVYVASSVIADTLTRTEPIKVLFNAGQYALAMVAAASVLAAGGAQPPVALDGAVLPLLLAAGLALLAVNHVLAGAGAGLLARLPIRRYLREDSAFQAWTVGCPLALAPALLAAAQRSLWLVPVSFAPMLAIYIGGRQAAVDSHRAYHDELTGLPNRSMLIARLREALESALHDTAPVAVMIIDLDDFKAINDTLGHEFGDRVLTQLSPRLRAAAGEGATLARLGGDEFALVLEGVGESGAADHAKRLLAALDRPLEVESLALHIAASVGIACFPQHGRTIDELLRHADVALYCAKASDDACEVYADAQDEYSLDRLALTAQLRRGIDRGELMVHYQPKVALQGGHRPCVEALVRWNHPQLGLIGPDGFVPLAEQAGLIKLLTNRVLEVALGQASAWRREGIEVPISVNVSMRNLLDHDLPETIRALLARFDLPAEVLRLEITESRIVADLGRARTVLHELRAMGLSIALDDFGTGFSSLSQLRQLPVDEIKIDRSFVMHMDTDRNDAALVRSIIDLGRNLGLDVTAEGVETAMAQRTLRELGCDFAQGYHLSRPVPADECRRYLETLLPGGGVPITLAAVAEEEKAA
jgi:diguanylate cyclase (GGDEF)-like protein